MGSIYASRENRSYNFRDTCISANEMRNLKLKKEIFINKIIEKNNQVCIRLNPEKGQVCCVDASLMKKAR